MFPERHYSKTGQKPIDFLSLLKQLDRRLKRSISADGKEN